MARHEPSRILNISGNMENDHFQQYVQVGSNIYLGTKDGIKYSLIQTPDKKLRLVDALNETDASLNPSKISWKSASTNEKSSEYENQWVTPTNATQTLKLIAPKPDLSSCKGQGDDIGNSVISPVHCFSSFKEAENVFEEVSLNDILTDNNETNPTYTTLVPKEEKAKSLNSGYYDTPKGPYFTYTCPCPSTFPPPVPIRPARCTKRPRMQLIPGTSLFSPIPRIQRSRGRIRRGSRQRRPRRNAYQYTPQILHSTPTTQSTMNFSTHFLTPVNDSSGANQSSDSFNKTQSSIEYPRVPNNTPNSAAADSAEDQKVYPLQWIPHESVEVENYDARESHNEKERNRRLRIKDSCDAMRSLLPCVVDKLDNASIFEQAVSFISFVRGIISNEDDMEFLERSYIC